MVARQKSTALGGICPGRWVGRGNEPLQHIPQMENTSPAAFRRSVLYKALAKHLSCLPLPVSLFLPLRNRANVNPLIPAGRYYNFCHNDVKTPSASHSAEVWPRSQGYTLGGALCPGPFLGLLASPEPERCALGLAKTL